MEMSESEPTKHTLGKIEPKQMMAHPKNEKVKSEYVTHNCIECEEDYLSQGIVQHEMDFCPNHVDLRFCGIVLSVLNISADNVMKKWRKI